MGRSEGLERRRVPLGVFGCRVQRLPAGMARATAARRFARPIRELSGAAKRGVVSLGVGEGRGSRTRRDGQVRALCGRAAEASVVRGRASAGGVPPTGVARSARATCSPARRLTQRHGRAPGTVRGLLWGPPLASAPALRVVRSTWKGRTTRHDLRILVPAKRVPAGPSSSRRPGRKAASNDLTWVAPRITSSRARPRAARTRRRTSSRSCPRCHGREEAHQHAQEARRNDWRNRNRGVESAVPTSEGSARWHHAAEESQRSPAGSVLARIGHRRQFAGATTGAADGHVGVDERDADTRSR